MSVCVLYVCFYVCMYVVPLAMQFISKVFLCQPVSPPPSIFFFNLRKEKCKQRKQIKSQFFLAFFVLAILSTHAKRVSISRIRDFFKSLLPLDSLSPSLPSAPPPIRQPFFFYQNDFASFQKCAKVTSIV